MRCKHLLYRLAWTLLLPLAWLRLLWRSRREPGYGQHIGERFARFDITLPNRPIWLHAVSVGEMQAAAPLLRALLSERTHEHFLLTCTTPAGRATAQRLFADQPRVHCVFLPYDHPRLVARFLRHFDPRCGLLLETELWPALIDYCHRQKRPLALVNARLSARSQRRYARFARRSSAQMLARLRVIVCQGEADRQRFIELGAAAATTHVTGNLKFDVTPDAAQHALGEQFRARFGRARRTLLFASSRAGEEALLLEALQRKPLPADVLLLIVPRHPQRFEQVAKLIESRPLRLQKRSDNAAVALDTQVWLGDAMGELSACYIAADLALIGGSWLALGGQNLIEACAVGTPVLLGPHTWNFAEISQQAIACGAAWRCADLEAALEQAEKLLNATETRIEAGKKAFAFAQQHRGACLATLRIINSALQLTD